MHLFLQRVTLVEGHMTYEMLREPSIPTFKAFYFFNLTNPEEFEAGNETAMLEEIGPFTYRYVILCENFNCKTRS